MVVLSCFCVFCGWFLLLESFSAERKLNPRPGKSLDKLEEVNHKGTKTQTRSESAWLALSCFCLFIADYRLLLEECSDPNFLRTVQVELSFTINRQSPIANRHSFVIGVHHEPRVNLWPDLFSPEGVDNRKSFLISLIQKVENLHNLEEVWR